MPIATFSLVALDCPDPLALAEFYQQITGGEIDTENLSSGWVQLHPPTGSDIAFQLDAGHEPPDWPVGTPQQMHIDFDVADLDEGEAQLLAIGARKAAVQPSPDSWRVYLDPAGHPLCLVKA